MSPVDPEKVFGLIGNPETPWLSVRGEMVYFKPQNIPVSKTMEFTVEDIREQRPTKFPLKGKDYCYRIVSSAGWIWDVASTGHANTLLKGCGVNQDGTLQRQQTFLIAKKSQFKTGESPYQVTLKT